MPFQYSAITDISHVPQFGGDVWFVNNTDGDDDNSGQSPRQAFATIGHAISVAAAGDAISVVAGTYDEDGLDLNLLGLELWCEIGVVLTNSTPGTVLTVSGNYCRAKGARFIQAGQTGLHVTGIRCEIDDCKSGPGNGTGFDIDGTACRLRSCHAGSYTVTGYDIGANGCSIRDSSAIGTGAATRGFYIHDGADRVRLWNCGSIGNATTGYEVAAGSVDTVIAWCVSGPNDGDAVDDGTYTMWASFNDRLKTEHHEHIYPYCAGQGVAGNPVTVNNTTTNGAGGTREDQYYWGDVVRIIPPDTLVTIWESIGLYVFATTANDDQQWQVLFTDPNYASAQNGGNAWVKNGTVLTVADGTLYQADDWVWVTGNDRPNGEIMLVNSVAGNVVTLVRETTADAQAGLRYDYNVDTSANTMYLVYRETLRSMHRFDGEHSAPSARSFMRVDWIDKKRSPANGGMIMRMLNATDAQASTFDVKAIYED